MSATEETRRTAFRAAFLMGPGGRELFRWIARGDDAEVRRSAVLSLYLQWRRDPAYVTALLDELVTRVWLPPVWRSGRVLRFIADLSITIYINHPERPEVLALTSRLWRAVLVRRLRLKRLLFLVRGPLGHQIGKAFSARTLQTALLPDLQDPGRFFAQSGSERARFLRMVGAVDPDVPIDGDAQRQDLTELLESDILLHRILAGIVIATHAIRDPEATGRLVDGLHVDLSDEAAFWTLLSYSVPLTTTPTSWTPQLERWTRILVSERRALLFDPDAILQQFDISLLPLGLAYGKQGPAMPEISGLLRVALQEDRELAVRLVRGLAAVGLYYPEAVFEALREHPDLFRKPDPDAASAVTHTMAVIRTLHFDRVDLFLGEMGATDALRTAIGSSADLGLIARCINWVGYYNNAVHQAVEYPAMRRTLLIGGLRAIGEARRPADFIGPYTDAAIEMARRADFELIRWTDPGFDRELELEGETHAAAG